MVLAASDDRFDHELAGWFARHGGPWSGTASELLAALETKAGTEDDLWPQSLRALYSHIESHGQSLRALGVDAMLHRGHPRMISLRSSAAEKPAAESSTGTFATVSSSDAPLNLPLADERKRESSDSGEVIPTRAEARPQDIALAEFGVITERLVNSAYAGGNIFAGGIFKSPEEALFALVEMRVQISEQGLELESAIDLVAERTQESTQICGIVVGLLRQDSVVYPSRTGVAATMGAPHFQANLFQFCLRTGRTLQLCDAQKHSHVGDACRRGGIGSLIIVPIFRNREIAGAIEFLFKERRSFSIGDVMDLERIAGIISESLSGMEQLELKPAKARECLPRPTPAENIEPKFENSFGVLLKEKESFVGSMAGSFRNTTEAQTSLTKSAKLESMARGLLASSLATAPTMFWLACKRARTRCERVMGLRGSETL